MRFYFIDMNRKRILSLVYPLVLIAVMFAVWKYREGKKPVSTDVVEIRGITMGTIQYKILYRQEKNKDFSFSIDSLLKVWNQSLSTYIPDSEISRFNQDSCFTFESQYFLPVLQSAKIVYENTHGAFDPTVGPLVNAWGFGPEKTNNPDSTKVDSLRQFVGFNKVTFSDKEVCKNIRGLKLDFSAIAKGYAVDVVADFLKAKGIENLLVEIGGELICFGDKGEGKSWMAGVEDPTVEIDEQRLFAKIQLHDKAMATSGNYRNYYVTDSIKYSHTINPATGYPVQRNILSASVVAKDCMTADAYATAFMVLGMEQSKEVLQKVKDIDAFLIYSEADGNLAYYSTKGVSSIIEVVNGQ